MTLDGSVEIVLHALRTNKLRAALAMLGVVVGVALVVVMVSIGLGTRHSVAAQVQALGSNLLGIFPGSAGQLGVRQSLGSIQTLTWQDADAIRSEVPEALEVAPEFARPARVISGAQNASINISGVTPAFEVVRNFRVHDGVFITPVALASRARTAVLGRTAVERLFGDREAVPLGAVIKIDRVRFTVVGVTEEKGFDGTVDWDDVVFVPLSTAQQRLFGVRHVRAIYVKVGDARLLPSAQEEIERLLRVRHRIPAGAEDDFVVRNQTAVLGLVHSITWTLTLMLGSIAAVSLIVGGTGITNIMLASVSERTREIGIRRALGARRRHILQEFLLEAALLSLAGGLVGVLAGVVGSLIISWLAGWVTFVSPATVAIAVLFAAAVGICSGLYPAQRAARVDPAVALRYE